MLALMFLHRQIVRTGLNGIRQVKNESMRIKGIIGFGARRSMRLEQECTCMEAKYILSSIELLVLQSKICSGVVTQW